MGGEGEWGEGRGVVAKGDRDGLGGRRCLPPRDLLGGGASPLPDERFELRTILSD